MASFEQRTPRCLPPGRTRRSPPEHCRVAKVYGLETTAMRDGGYNPPHTYSSKHYGRPRSDDDYAPYKQLFIEPPLPRNSKYRNRGNWFDPFVLVVVL